MERIGKKVEELIMSRQIPTPSVYKLVRIQFPGVEMQTDSFVVCDFCKRPMYRDISRSVRVVCEDCLAYLYDCRMSKRKGLTIP